MSEADVDAWMQPVAILYYNVSGLGVAVISCQANPFVLRGTPEVVGTHADWERTIRSVYSEPTSGRVAHRICSWIARK